MVNLIDHKKMADELWKDTEKGVPMSDTPEELRTAEYLDEHDLTVCSECGEEVPKSEITTDLGDEVCEFCHDEVARTCKRCGTVTGKWDGTDAERGFFCDRCQRGMDREELKSEMYGDLTEACDVSEDR